MEVPLVEPELIVEEPPSQESGAPEVTVEEPLLQEVVAPDSEVEKPPPQANMALEPELIPPATVSEVTTFVAGRIVSEVSVADFLGRLPQFSSFPRVMEVNPFDCGYILYSGLMSYWV